MTDKAERNKLEGIESIRRFVMGGNSTLTVSDSETNEHVTLRLRLAPEGRSSSRPIFVKLFTGSDNTRRGHYKYVGCIWTTSMDGTPCGAKFSHSMKGGIDRDDARLRTLQDLLRAIRLEDPETLPSSVSVWHEGRCCFCNLVLTQTESVRCGYGPDCAKQRGLPYGKRTTPKRANMQRTTPHLRDLKAEEQARKEEQAFDAEISRRDRQDTRLAAEAKMRRDQGQDKVSAGLVGGTNGVFYEIE